MTTTGGKAVPPMMVVLPPSVSVTGGSCSVSEPQKKIPPEPVEVAVGLIMEVVPPATLVSYGQKRRKLSPGKGARWLTV